MEKRLLLATGNPKKQREMDELLQDFGWEVLTLKAFPDAPEVIEDGETFIANAIKKAVSASIHSGLPSLADDSGLEVDALGGKPGVYSARYARGEGSTDEENLQRVVDELAGVPEGQRTGRFVCAMAVAQGDTVLFETQRTVEGLLIDAPRGEGGFGYDPIFYYPPFEQTFAEVPAREKHAVSHRGQAMRDVVDFLTSHYS